MTDEFSDNPVIGAFQSLKKGTRFLRAIQTPTEPSDYIWKYGIQSFNTETGHFIYSAKKPIQMNEHQRPYKIMFMLFSKPGSEVLYPQIADKLQLPYRTTKEKRETRAKIRQIFKQIRRTLGINAYDQPKENPVVMSGKGIKLALIL